MHHFYTLIGYGVTAINLFFASKNGNTLVSTVCGSKIIFIPKDYKRMIENIDKAHKAGLSGEEALMAAFHENFKD